MVGDCCVFEFLLRSVEGKDLKMRFQSSTFVFKSLQRSVHAALEAGGIHYLLFCFALELIDISIEIKQYEIKNCKRIPE